MTNTSTTTSARNQSVDTFRLLAALGVVILQVEYPNVPSEIAIRLRLMSRWAIPFFFLISGYFLAANHTKSSRLNVQPAVERLISPKQVIGLADYIYLQAYCHTREAERTFRLDRIIEVAVEVQKE